MIRVEGYAAVFDAVDRAGDVVRRGAFADAACVPLLVQHRGRAVGRIEAIGEDARGLRVVAVVAHAGVARAVASGALGGKGGGGRPDMAQAGGPDGSKADAALKAIESALGA